MDVVILLLEFFGGLILIFTTMFFLGKLFEPKKDKEEKP
jgi:hypothetical protein